jgi:hypothetical protein
LTARCSMEELEKKAASQTHLWFCEEAGEACERPQAMRRLIHQLLEHDLFLCGMVRLKISHQGEAAKRMRVEAEEGGSKGRGRGRGRSRSRGLSDGAAYNSIPRQPGACSEQTAHTAVAHPNEPGGVESPIPLQMALGELSLVDVDSTATLYPATQAALFKHRHLIKVHATVSSPAGFTVCHFANPILLRIARFLVANFSAENHGLEALSSLEKPVSPSVYVSAGTLVHCSVRRLPVDAEADFSFGSFAATSSPGTGGFIRLVPLGWPSQRMRRRRKPRSWVSWRLC